MLRVIRKRSHAVAPALALVLVAYSTAHAITAGTGITMLNGQVSLSVPVAVTSGGTGVTSAADDSLLVGNGTGWASTAAPSCSGANAALTYSASSNAFGCNTISSGVIASLPFTSETKIDLSDSTAYLGLGGRVSLTESDVAAPISAATLANLRCNASAPVGGTSLTVTLGKANCGSALVYTGTPSVVPTGTAAVSDTATSATVGAAQCVALRVVAAGNTDAVFVNCTIDKTANS